MTEQKVLIILVRRSEWPTQWYVKPGSTTVVQDSIDHYWAHLNHDTYTLIRLEDQWFDVPNDLLLDFLTAVKEKRVQI